MEFMCGTGGDTRWVSQLEGLPETPNPVVLDCTLGRSHTCTRTQFSRWVHHYVRCVAYNGCIVTAYVIRGVCACISCTLSSRCRWSEWSTCSRLCGEGTQTRTRTEKTNPSGDCPPLEETRSCDLGNCRMSSLKPPLLMTNLRRVLVRVVFSTWTHLSFARILSLSLSLARALALSLSLSLSRARSSSSSLYLSFYALHTWKL